MMSTKASKKKSEQLGMNHSTAANRLRKIIIFVMMQELNEDYCLHCGNRIVHINDLSIEHIEPWLDSDDPVGLYFDTSNIAFSHLSCNSAAARYNPEAGPKKGIYPAHLKKWRASLPELKHGTTSKYSQGCRCNDCRRAQAEYMKEYRQIPENRDAHNTREKKRYREQAGIV